MIKRAVVIPLYIYEVFHCVFFAFSYSIGNLGGFAKPGAYMPGPVPNYYQRSKAKCSAALNNLGNPVYSYYFVF
jgi:hypothetical protein